MDAQYPFASRDDIWRVIDELKDLHEAQAYQGDRITRLERNQDDNARMKNIWGTSPSPIHTGIGGSIPTGTASCYYHFTSR
jgi:hypothetical protein